LIAKAHGALISSFDIVIILLVLAAPLAGRLKDMLPYIHRFRVGEFEVELSQLKHAQSEQQELLNAAIRTLVVGFLTEDELMQLKNIAGNEPFLVTPRPELEREMRRLAGLGLIRWEEGGSISRLMRQPPHDVRLHLEITDAGKKFLQMRDEFLRDQSTAPVATV
jgi:hypothetical protein